MEITIQLPETIARRLGATPGAVARRVLEAVAITEYRAGQLSHRQVGHLLGLNYWATENFLAARGVQLPYDQADLAADQEALDRILGKL